MKWLGYLWQAVKNRLTGYDDYCLKCSSCGDYGCKCWHSCVGGAFCKYGYLLPEYRAEEAKELAEE